MKRYPLAMGLCAGGIVFCLPAMVGVPGWASAILLIPAALCVAGALLCGWLDSRDEKRARERYWRHLRGQ